MNKTLIQLIILSMIFCGQSLQAEQIKIPVGSQSSELNNITRPTMGMSKALVKSQYGAPITEKAAVGKPPISSWEYAHFIVYFEYDHVIDSVLKETHHESTTTVVRETVVVEPVPEETKTTEQKEMPEEDLDLNAK